MTFHRIGILLCALALFGCAGEKQVEVEVPTDGKVEGTLTINGKDYPLKYIYTGRHKPDHPEYSWDKGEIELLITNEPVSYQFLSKIFLEFSVDGLFAEESEALRGTSINAFYLTFSPGVLETTTLQGDGAPYEGYLLTPDAAFKLSMSSAEDAFDEITHTDGTLKAKDKNTWEQSELGANLQEVKITASYSFSIDANIKGETLLTRSFSSENKAWQSAQARLPEEGSAKGTVTLSDDPPIEVTHAYAMREKLPELGKVITVILTDKAIPKERLLFSFERSVPKDSCGLYLHIDDSGKLRESVVKWSSGMSVAITGRFAETDIKDFRVENGRVIGGVENVEDRGTARYAVSFDAPVRE